MTGPLHASRKVLITGGAQGLGRAFAERFIAEGASVVITDIQGGKAKEVANEIGAAAGLSHDVASQEDWTSVGARAAATLGGINCLVHNAGIGGVGNIETENLESYRKIMAVDVDSVFVGTQTMLPYMKDTGPGSIIVISSVAGLLAQPEFLSYHTAKAAVSMLSKCIALHCAKQKYDITCNSVHPVFTRTPIIEPMIAMKASREEGEAALSKNIPLRRLGEPEEVAAMVSYLASDDARFVTGSEFVIDGGMTA
ncbi:MAG: SDR family oxidoreductase [Parvularcula sp.]